MDPQAIPHAVPCPVPIVQASLPQRASRQHVQLHASRAYREHGRRQSDVPLQNRRVALAERWIHARKRGVRRHADRSRDVRRAPAILPARVQQNARVALQTSRRRGRCGLVMNDRRVGAAADDRSEAVAQTLRETTPKRCGLRGHVEFCGMLVDVGFEPANYNEK